MSTCDCAPDLCDECWDKKYYGFFSFENDRGVFLDKEGLQEADDVYDPKIVQNVYVAYKPCDNFYFQVLHYLRSHKLSWEYLNRAVRINRPTNWKKEINPQDEYDESREYPPLEIEFADEPIRHMNKSYYLNSEILYKYSVSRNRFFGKRYWRGILVEGDNDNFCAYADVPLSFETIQVITFSGEIG